MLKVYEAPTLERRSRLSEITAQQNFVSPGFAEPPPVVVTPPENKEDDDDKGKNWWKK